VNVSRLHDGLWRWTGLHPGWRPGLGWEREVGCVYAELPDAILLVDPLVPPEDAERFLRHLDADVERLGLPVSIVLTTGSHRRSADELAARYGAAVGGPEPEGAVAYDLTAYDLGWRGERAWWLAGHCALVLGDAVRGDGAGGVALADALLGDGAAGVRAVLRQLLELPVETLLPAHGQAVPTGGRDALARAAAV